MLRALAFMALTSFLISSANAQDRDGNDTPGDWRPSHDAHFGQWDTSCDYRALTKNGEGREDRCYIRYVDVFSQRPKFGAVFFFVIPEPDGYKVEFGFEDGTVFDDEGILISSGSSNIWSFSQDPCLSGGACTFTRQDATTLIEALVEGEAMQMNFVDRHGEQQNLTWDVARFDEVLADFETETEKRNLRNQ